MVPLASHEVPVPQEIHGIYAAEVDEGEGVDMTCRTRTARVRM